MELQQLEHADYLDIIYDNRNKNYGGYELRKHYSRRMIKAVLILSLSLTGLAMLSFVKHTDTEPVRAQVMTPITITQVTMPVVEQPKTALAKQATPKVKTEAITPPKIVDDLKPDDTRMASAKDLQTAVAGPETTSGTPAGNGNVVSGAAGNETSKGDIAQPKVATPLVVSTVMPAFEGDLGAYLASHLRYPEAAREAGIEGQVIIRFVVNEDGSVSDATVARSIGGGCDEEALRIVRSMPHWKPGKNNGLPVKVFFALPIKFQLQ